MLHSTATTRCDRTMGQLSRFGIKRCQLNHKLFRCIICCSSFAAAACSGMVVRT
jgi:hypothetical protein